MKKLSVLVAAVSIASAQASEFNVKEYLDKTYITVGVGYKFQETDYYFSNGKFDDPYSARIKIEYRLNKYISYGVDHHSQWMTGFPVNNDKNEPSKTEIFIDYTVSLGDIF